jgi:GxxExxY protein
MISINHKDTKDTKTMKVFEPLPPETEALAKQTVDAAMKVHRALGPGLLESVYEKCLAHELHARQIRVQRQVSIPIVYEGLRLEAGLRLDMFVDNQLVVEIKAVEQMNRLFKAQVISYLRLMNLRLALLINFNVALLREGIERVIL